MMRHRFFACLTVLALLGGMTAVPERYCIAAQAEKPFQAFVDGELVPSGPINDTLTYSIEDGTLTISGTGALPDSWLAPLLPNNASSWRIDFQEPVRAIVIEPGVTRIGSNAFESFKNAETVSIPDTVTAIGEWAFWNCPSLREAQIPDGVTEIGAHAFGFCTSLPSVTVPESCRSIGDEAFTGCSSLTDVTIPESTEIGSRILLNTPWLAAQQEQNPLVMLCGSVQDGTLCKGEVVIPEGTRSLSKGAFHGCTDLTAVTIPESIRHIPEHAFAGCSSLQSVTILNPYCTIALVYGEESGYPPVPNSSTICNRVETDDSYFDGWTHYKAIYTGVIRSYEGSAAQKFAEEYGYAFESLGAPPELEPGNVNGDDTVNASDAAVVLTAAAAIGANTDSGLNTAQRSAANVNHDGAVNATDAALILQYAAYFGAGGRNDPLLSFQSYLYEQSGAVTRVSVDINEYWSYDHADVQLITSPAELEDYFTDRTPKDIGTVDPLLHRDADTVRAELMEAYPAAFFETHHLAALGVAEPNTNTLQEVRHIEAADGTVTIQMHHSEVFGQPVEGRFTVLVAVDKSITDASQITVEETRSSRYD